ncbi:prepilin peptidase [Actinomycetospora sp. TBRC 11914]|uniref:prepilin peptidase n=1 Tax=Actinomycetospora sp. TBRC 11914 TaxID=2729387 RepID=UPI00145EB13E|nr:prepilin peptidase [Actinomycetospora sp. TBRC 11914]NMO89633.1 prepilin peptidase [Actinomycetospora sp. TBRC 11914]
MTGDLPLGVLLGVLLPLAGGALLGAGVRAGLARGRRPVLLPWAWCVVGTACGCGMVATAAVVGGAAASRVPVLLVVTVLAVAGSATDAVAGRLPDVLTVPALVLGLAALVPSGALPAGLAGAVVLGGLHAGVAFAAPAALGGGDVKLAAALGGPLAAAGWWALAAAPALAAAVLVAVAWRLRRRAVPLGPALLGVTWILLLVPT